MDSRALGPESGCVLLDARRNGTNRTPTMVRKPPARETCSVIRSRRTSCSTRHRSAASRAAGENAKSQPRQPLLGAIRQNAAKSRVCYLPTRASRSCRPRAAIPAPGSGTGGGCGSQVWGLAAPNGIARWMPGGAQNQRNVLLATQMGLETSPGGKKHPVSAPTTDAI